MTVFYVHVTMHRNKFLCNKTTNCPKYVDFLDKINLWNWCI